MTAALALWMTAVSPTTFLYDYIYSSCVHTHIHAAGGVLCSFRENGCTVDFEVALSGPHNTIGMVFVGEERGELKDCVSLYSVPSMSCHGAQYLLYYSICRVSVLYTCALCVGLLTCL